MERLISAVQANREYPSLLRAVRDGASYIVANHGKPVACIAPADRHEAVAAAARELLLQRLAAQPVAEIGPWSRDELYEDEA